MEGAHTTTDGGGTRCTRLVYYIYHIRQRPVLTIYCITTDGYTAQERTLIQEICTMAGLEAHLVNESVAAVLGYRKETPYEEGDLFLVHDFGATKLTVAAIRIVNDYPEIVYSRTHFNVSGQGMDDKLVEIALQRLAVSRGQVRALVADKRHAPSFRHQIQEMKHNLCTQGNQKVRST